MQRSPGFPQPGLIRRYALADRYSAMYSRFQWFSRHTNRENVPPPRRLCGTISPTAKLESGILGLKCCASDTPHALSVRRWGSKERGTSGGLVSVSALPCCAVPAGMPQLRVVSQRLVDCGDSQLLFDSQPRVWECQAADQKLTTENFPCASAFQPKENYAEAAGFIVVFFDFPEQQLTQTMRH